MFVEILLLVLVALGILIFSISVHESAHAWMAFRLGDPTAKYLGRITLNPFAHIDPIGTVFLPLVFLLTAHSLLGWAKPTPFNPWNLKNPRRDAALISLAGPASNLLIATLIAIPFRLGFFNLNSIQLLSIIGNIKENPQLFFSYTPSEKLILLLCLILFLNVLLTVFNLIPIHPLDGFKVVGGLLPKDLYYQWITLEQYGPILLLFIIFFGSPLLSAILGPISFSILKILVG
jgi:Zn-dependent protease